MKLTERIRAVLTCALVLGLLAAFPLVKLRTPDQEISAAERRKLAQLPEMTADAVFSGRYFQDLETYSLEQFPFRDSFRAGKALLNTAVFQRLDNNGYYLLNGSLCKLDDPLNEKQVLLGAKKLNSLRDRWFPDSRCFYGIIPSKNDYAGAQNGYPIIGCAEIARLMQEHVTGMEYLDLYPALSLEDYYRTDTHWRQERLDGVLEVLGGGIGISFSPLSAYKANTISGFRGVYAGQSALPAEGEDLIYLTSPLTEKSRVWNAESGSPAAVYQPEKFTGIDPYDVFLSGAVSLLEIDTGENNGRELIFFRDSFGSSLAPLLLSGYSKVTLVDLRYISSESLGESIDFHGQDVLFLYSTGVLNSSAMLR